MGWGIVPIGLLAALVLLLVSAGIEDARRREIADAKNIAIAVLAPLWWWANGLALWPDIALQVALAGGVFALFLVAFHFGVMGGGDVKMIAALALWLPLQPLAWMLVTMSLAGGVVTLLMLAERLWRQREGAIEVPYGVAIAAAGLLTLREPLINHFG